MDVDDALKALKARGAKPHVKKTVVETIDRISSFLVLLNASLLSPESSQKLVSLFRHSLASLYPKYPHQALQLSSSVLTKIYDQKILSSSADAESGWNEWESVANGLLSGVLDFLESHESEKNKDLVASFFYTTICHMCFAGNPIATALSLRCTCYMLLSETTAGRGANQRTLRDSKLLGGAKLGLALSLTKDFLALEGLLTLLARLLPPTESTPSGRAKRTAFIREVWLSTEALSCGNEIAELLECIASSNWEDTSMRIIDVLARGDVSFPQPFALDQFCMSGVVFPQPTSTDRLYVDREGFFLNAVTESNDYESLSIPYSTVHEISLSYSISPTKPAQVVARLTSLPPIPVLFNKSIENAQEDGIHTLSFEIADARVPRFVDSLENRVGNLVCSSKSTKQKSKPRVSITESSANLDFGQSSQLCNNPQQNVKEVERFYNTNETSEDSPPKHTDHSLSEYGQVLHKTAVSKGRLSRLSGDVNRVEKEAETSTSTLLPSYHQSSLTGHRTPTTTRIAIAPPPPVRTRTKIVRDAVFGASDEELSELSDMEGEDLLTSLPIDKSGVGKSHLEANGRGSKMETSRTDSKPRLATGHESAVDSSDESQMISRSTKRSTAARAKRIIVSDDEEPPKALPPSAQPSSPSEVHSSESVHATAKKTTLSCPRSLMLSTSVAPGALVEANSLKNQENSESASRTKSSDTTKIKNKAIMRKSPQLANNNAKSTLPGNTSKSESKSQSEPRPGHTADEIDPSDESHAVHKTRSTRASAAAAKKLLAAIRAKESTDKEKLVDTDVLSRPATATEPKATVPASDQPTLPSATRPAEKRKLGQEEGRSDTSEGDRPAVKRTKVEAMMAAPPSAPRELQVLKLRSIAVTRPTTKYGRRKGRASSPDIRLSRIDPDDGLPQAFVPPAVNFDELPCDSTRLTVSATHVAKATIRTQTANRRENHSTSTPVKSGKAAPRKNARRKEKDSKISPSYSPPAGSDPIEESTPVAASTWPSETQAQSREPLRDESVKPNQLPQEKVSRSATKLDDDVKTLKQSWRDSKQGIAGGPSDQKPESEAKLIERSLTTLKKPKKAPWETSQFLQSSRLLSAQVDYDNEDQLPIHAESSDDPQIANETVLDSLDVADGAFEPLVCDDAASRKISRPQSPDDSKCYRLDVSNNPHNLAGVTKLLYEGTVQAVVSSTDRPNTAPIFTQKRDVDMIDLTHDDELTSIPHSPMYSRFTSRNVDDGKPMALPLESPVKYEVPRHHPSPLKETSRSPLVTFASSKTICKDPQDEVFNGKKFAIRNVDINRTANRFIAPLNMKGKGCPVLEDADPKSYNENEAFAQHTPDMQDVVEVINSINQILIDKITNKFEGVKSDVRAGRYKVLREAAMDLDEMRLQSATHFNRLIDIETEYANCGRRLNSAYEDMFKVNEEICGMIRQTVHRHDRATLSKTMPTSLFSAPLPKSLNLSR